jgi:hypothetical protein
LGFFPELNLTSRICVPFNMGLSGLNAKSKTIKLFIKKIDEQKRSS